MGARIHPTAVIAADARIADSAEVGAFCSIGPKTILEAGVVLHSHVTISGHTRLGRDVAVFPQASLGCEPQDMKFAGEESYLEIGARSVIRENVTISRGTQGGGLLTRIGADCLIQCNSHVGHDCMVGDHVVFSANAMTAGHCQIDDFAILGGVCGIQQFVRIGKYAMVGGMTGVRHDVLPYALITDIPGTLKGLNLVGLRRHGFSTADIRALQQAYRLLFSAEATLRRRAESLPEAFPGNPHVALLRDFVLDMGRRSLCMPDERVRESGFASQ